MNYETTNSGLYSVVDVDVTGLTYYNGAFHGTISIETEERGWIDITGEHGAHDYEEDYGIVLAK